MLYVKADLHSIFIEFQVNNWNFNKFFCNSTKKYLQILWN